MKKNEENQKLMLDQLKKSPVIQIACEKTGISRASYYRWRQDDPEFAKLADKSLDEGKLLVNDLAESMLISAIKDKNVGAILAWLRAHHDDYKNRVQVEGTINTIQELSPEQKILVKQALALANLKLNHNDNDQQ